MSFNLVEIYKHMGLFALLIAWTLVAMAVASLAVFFERLFVYARSKRKSRAFAQRAAVALEGHAHERLVSEAQCAKGSHLATLLGTGLRTFLKRSAERPGKLGAVELTRRELVRESERVAVDVRRGLSVLATVGSVAPFVGLLGTVVGIIEAFAGIAKEGSGGLGAVSGGIAEALVVTALGLLVAIPAVFAYNFLTTRSEGLLLTLEQAKSELMDYLENLTGDARPQPAPDAAVRGALEAPVAHRNGESTRRA